jgi:hypothetical protein
VDTGSIESKVGGLATDMNLVESRFKHNIQVAIGKAKSRIHLFIHKNFSDDCLSRLLCEGKKKYFDFIYIRGPAPTAARQLFQSPKSLRETSTPANRSNTH